MASSSSYLPLLAIIISSLSIPSIAARPCKTFLISSYSLSITPENPNLESSSTRFVTVFTIRRLYPVPLFVNRRHGLLPSSAAAAEKPQIREDHPQIPFSENVKDRTRDILSVVAALLFGAGCGALTAATMYLAWAFVVDRRGGSDFEEDDYENEESDAASLKKLGYVKIQDPAPVKEAA